MLGKAILTTEFFVAYTCKYIVRYVDIICLPILLKCIAVYILDKSEEIGHNDANRNKTRILTDIHIGLWA